MVTSKENSTLNVQSENLVLDVQTSNGAEAPQTVNNPFESVSTVTLKQLESKGYKFARFGQNRLLDEANLKGLSKSIEVNGVLSPITVIDASKAIAEGEKLFDFETNDPVPAPANKYFAILDGQHRYQAILDLRKKVKDHPIDCVVIKSNSDVPIKDQLIEINNVSKKWISSDYINSIVSSNNKYPLINAISELTKKGYESTAAFQILTFQKSGLSTAQFSKIAKGEKLTEKVEEKLKLTSGIERGKNILSTLEAKFGNDKILLKGRLFSEFIIGKYDNTDDSEKATFKDDMISFFNSLTPDQVTAIKTVKSGDGQTKGQKFNELLNGYYETFKEPELKESV